MQNFFCKKIWNVFVIGELNETYNKKENNNRNELSLTTELDSW